jgi:predicted GNAT family acetyltransferase
MSDVTVVHDETTSRYELRDGEDVVGFASYRWEDGRLVMDHTVVDPQHREQGHGTTLARGALDDVRRRGLRVVPQCPFIRSFVEENPEYADLVDETPDEV